MSSSDGSGNTLKPYKPKEPDLADHRKGGNPLKKPTWAGHGDWRDGGKWNPNKYKDKKK